MNLNDDVLKEFKRDLDLVRDKISLKEDFLRKKSSLLITPILL